MFDSKKNQNLCLYTNFWESELHRLLRNQKKSMASWSGQQVLDSLRIPGAWLFCCSSENAQELLGVILCRRIFSECEILFVYVDRCFRMHGVGRSLVQGAMSELKNEGGKEFFLEVSSKNKGAHALYEQCGFSQIGFRPKYYSDGSDCWLMGCQVGR